MEKENGKGAIEMFEDIERREEVNVLMENDDVLGVFYSFEEAKEIMDGMIKDKLKEGWTYEDCYDETDMEIELVFINENGDKFWLVYRVIQSSLY